MGRVFVAGAGSFSADGAVFDVGQRPLFGWIELRAERFKRVWLLALILIAATIYFAAIWAAGLKLRQLVRR